MTKQILIIRANGTTEPFSGPVTLDNLKKAVNGYIEHVRVLDRIEDGKFIFTTMYVNEEGLLHGLPRNAAATEIYQRNIRAQFPDSANPFRDADARWNKEQADAGRKVIDITPETVKAAGYDDNPFICGDVVMFEGYTCEEADELFGDEE